MKCPVCLESFNSEKKTVSTQCGHLIHDECIQNWMDKGTNTCPKCRAKITNRQGNLLKGIDNKTVGR